MPTNAPNTKTRIASQKVHHTTRFRRSYHHWEMVRGVASSYACFRTTRRFLQNLNLSIRRASAGSVPQAPSLESILVHGCLERRFWSHDHRRRLKRPKPPNSDSGKINAKVSRVSSKNPSGNIELISSYVRPPTQVFFSIGLTNLRWHSRKDA